MFSAFIDMASPLLLTSSFLSSYRPAFLYDRRGDFFLPTHHHVIIACLPSGMSLSSRAVRFFVGFIWDRLLTRPAVPHPPFILSGSATYDVIVPIASLIGSPCVLIVLRPVIRHAGRGGGAC